jgi:two-component system, cell cycle sensor histidine kinase and response regulator CckA
MMIASMKDMTDSANLGGSWLEKGDMEAIATLAGGIAHQFNNALVAIVGSIDLLQMDLSGNPEVEKYASTMRSAVRRMTRLTDQLLAYARGGKYQPVRVSLNDIVEEGFPEIERGAGADIYLEKHLKVGIQDVMADPGQLLMVLSALVENSKEAMEGEGWIRISTNEEFLNFDSAAPSTGRWVSVEVMDTGRGMSEAVKGRMFEPFFTTKLMGRGLSMAAVYGIVKNHDGWIQVDSTPGMGTTVRIMLPPASVSGGPDH